MIIINRKGALGDVLFLTPIVRELKKRFPEIGVGISSYYHEIFNNNPYVDVKGKNLVARQGHDGFVNLDGYYEAYMNNHPVYLYAEKILGDTNIGSGGLELFYTEQDCKIVDKWFDENINKSRKTVICHLGNTWVKMHTHIWEEVLNYLVSKHNIILVGRGTEYSPVCRDCINLTGDIFNIQRMAYLISKCNLFLGTDSGVSHIASCTPVPQVVCYSFIAPEWRRPLNKDNFKSIVADCPTPHCAHEKKIIENGEFRGVTCNYQQCSLDIKNSQIINAVEELM